MSAAEKSSADSQSSYDATVRVCFCVDFGCQGQISSACFRSHRFVREVQSNPASAQAPVLHDASVVMSHGASQ
jgi:hypothetical protein